MNYYLRRPKKKKVKTDDLFETVRLTLPKGLFKIVSDLAIEKQISPSRLISFAIDNELDTPKPFNYPCDLPTDEYKEYTYVKEAGLILQFLKIVPNGVLKQTIALCRRDIGIESRKVLLAALRELFEKEIVEEFKPRRMIMEGLGLGSKKIRIREYNNLDDVRNRELENADEQS